MSGTNYTQTPNLHLFKPIFNADVSNWGQHWNQNADTLDGALLASAATATYLPLAGGTVSGQLTISGTLTANAVRISMPHLPQSTGTPADLSSKGIVSGDLYNNGGVVCVAP
jgi:hypothetical protein